MANRTCFMACGFRPDEIARRKLETITEALNEGWRPDWNNTNEYKYFPWFRILPGKGKDAEGRTRRIRRTFGKVLFSSFGVVC